MPSKPNLETYAVAAEDACVQSMPDASPGKWHLAHTTWFFETVVLRAYASGYREFDPRFAYLFNSYYESLGARHPRALRGLLTRPSLNEIHAYRSHVDRAVRRFIECADASAWDAAEPLIRLGLQHEQQHQELILADALHMQWTRSSSYDPYPGFRPLVGAVGEYDGELMVGQIVLRGSSVATPAGHARRSYRDFFAPAARWQFSGLRLAQDA